MQLLWGSGCCVALWAPAVLVQRRRHVSRGTPHFQLCFLQGPHSFLRKGPGVSRQEVALSSPCSPAPQGCPVASVPRGVEYLGATTRKGPRLSLAFELSPRLGLNTVAAPLCQPSSP